MILGENWKEIELFTSFVWWLTPVLLVQSQQYNASAFQCYSEEIVATISFFFFLVYFCFSSPEYLKKNLKQTLRIRSTVFQRVHHGLHSFIHSSGVMFTGWGGNKMSSDDIWNVRKTLWMVLSITCIKISFQNVCLFIFWLKWGCLTWRIIS